MASAVKIFSAAINSGTPAWLNPSYATVEDGTTASVQCTTTARTSGYLCCSAPGFSAGDIPDGSTITGIALRVLGQLPGNWTFGAELSKDNGSTAVGTAKSLGTATANVLMNYVFGADGDLWGTTWTVIEARSIAARIKATNSSSFAGSAYVDAVEVTVYFAPPPANPVNAAFSSGGSSAVAASGVRVALGSVAATGAATVAVSGEVQRIKVDVAGAATVAMAGGMLRAGACLLAAGASAALAAGVLRPGSVSPSGAATVAAASRVAGGGSVSVAGASAVLVEARVNKTVLMSPSSGANSGQAYPWANPGNVVAKDGVGTASNPPVGDSTDFLGAYFDAFSSLPANALVQGYQVRARVMAASGNSPQWQIKVLNAPSYKQVQLASTGAWQDLATGDLMTLYPLDAATMRNGGYAIPAFLYVYGIGSPLSVDWMGLEVTYLEATQYQGALGVQGSASVSVSGMVLKGGAVHPSGTASASVSARVMAAGGTASHGAASALFFSGNRLPASAASAGAASVALFYQRARVAAWGASGVATVVEAGQVPKRGSLSVSGASSVSITPSALRRGALSTSGAAAVSCQCAYVGGGACESRGVASWLAYCQGPMAGEFWPGGASTVEASCVRGRLAGFGAGGAGGAAIAALARRYAAFSSAGTSLLVADGTSNFTTLQPITGAASVSVSGVLWRPGVLLSGGTSGVSTTGLALRWARFQPTGSSHVTQDWLLLVPGGLSAAGVAGMFPSASFVACASWGASGLAGVPDIAGVRAHAFRALLVRCSIENLSVGALSLVGLTCTASTDGLKVQVALEGLE